MRYARYIFPFLFLLVTNFTQAQVLMLPGNGEITVKEVSNDTIYFLPIKVNHPLASPLDIDMSDPNLRSQTADRGKDYDVMTPAKMRLTNTSPEYFSLGIKVYSRKIKSDVKTLQVNFLYTLNKTMVTQTLTVKIEPFVPLVDKKELPDTSRWVVRIVTGSNFDFFDAPTFKNFAGDLNIFLPDLIQFKNKKDKKPNKKKLSLGLQAGIFNYRYFESDSSRGTIRSDRYLLDPSLTTAIPDTTRYINETYALNTKTNFNTIGAYLNPIISVYDNKWMQLYVNIHIEGLWRTQILEETKVSIRKDTVTFTSRDVSQGAVLQAHPGLRPAYVKKSFNDVYVGIGMPLKIDVKKTFEFFVTPTIGWANYEGISVRTGTRGNIVSRTFTNQKVNELFLLTKAQLTTRVAPVDITLGGEFRKIAGQHTFYALYIGAALSLDKLKR